MSTWSWQLPRLRSDEEEHRERRTSWLELFHDLMFVAVIAQLSQFQSEHGSARGLLQFVLLFVPVWWVWIGGNFYNERFETEDLSQRVFTFLQMLPLATMAASVHEGFGRTADAYGWSYIAARSIILFMWLRAGWHNPEARPMTDRFALGFTLSIACWVLSIGKPLPEAMFLRGLGLFLDPATPFTTFRQIHHVPTGSPRSDSRNACRGTRPRGCRNDSGSLAAVLACLGLIRVDAGVARHCCACSVRCTTAGSCGCAARRRQRVNRSGPRVSELDRRYREVLPGCAEPRHAVAAAWPPCEHGNAGRR